MVVEYAVGVEERILLGGVDGGRVRFRTAISELPESDQPDRTDSDGTHDARSSAEAAAWFGLRLRRFVGC